MDLVDLSTWNVVAVDDEPDSLEVLIEALSMHDASVHGATSGPEALRLLETLHPTLVITDLSMPVMDGYQLLHRIRRMDGFKGTPVIALTAHAMAGDRERILAAGFDGYVSKPLRIATLVSDLLAIAPSLNPNAPVLPAQPEQPEESLGTTSPAQPEESLKPAPAQPEAPLRPSFPAPMDESLEPPTAQPPARPEEALKPAPAQLDEMFRQ
jgi:CheY-like chemotaxis protein